MGLRDVWSSGSDIQDVASVLQAFEEMNECRIRVLMTVLQENRFHDLVLQVEVWDQHWDKAEAKRLASASVTCYGTNLRTLPAAVIHALYMVDGKLARQEMRGEPES